MSRRLLRRSLLLAALLSFSGPPLAVLYTDWLWFGELGYQQVFTTVLVTRTALFAGVFALAVAWLVLNFRIALASGGDSLNAYATPLGSDVTLPSGRHMKVVAILGACLVAFLAAWYASSQWLTWLSWRNGVPFGEVDPILGRDISFYVFTLPFLRLTLGLAQTLTLFAGLGSMILYFRLGSLTSTVPQHLSVAPAARRHLSILTAVFLLTLAVGAWLGRAERLLSASALIHGAAYVDIHARMPVGLLLTVTALVGVLLSTIHSRSRDNWRIPAAVGLYVAVSVGGDIYGSMLQRFVVAPNEQIREAPYIQHNIDATRRAFALDTIEEQELSGDAPLTSGDIMRNSATLENVRLWDHQPLLDTFGQLQEIRTYYDFVSVDNDRYRVDGKYRQVMLSARELNSASLPNRTWVNERLTFTHGYGLTLGPVNEVTSEGLPVLFVQNLPPETKKDLPIKEPSIYFGELSNDYVIVNTETREFHYPQGDDNVFTQYSGRGGVPMSSFWRKLLFALRFGSNQILLSNDISPESRIIFKRNITERLSHIAPFLRFDGDPYMVVVDGRLMWMHDAYTVTGQYPYATPAASGVNYMRNAVKAVTDAYHGTTTLYLADPHDAIVATYARAFPGLFRPLNEMPTALRDHVRYPEDLFAMQASIYSTYHMTQPAVFYNREDQWQIPAIDEGGQPRPMEPSYTIMRLPGQADAEFIQMLPFTPRQKDNLAAWLVAPSDGEKYGRLRAFHFPKQKLIFGPRQVVARISQDQVIAPQITLWNQQGSAVIWGTLMVIPVEESLIYVRPLYLRAPGGRIPELTRVVVAYQSQIVMEKTLNAALARLFGGSPDQTSANDAQDARQSGTDRFDAQAAEARAHYDRAIAASRAGDWARYGSELRRLGETLEKMKE